MRKLYDELLKYVESLDINDKPTLFGGSREEKDSEVFEVTINQEDMKDFERTGIYN